MAKWSRMVLLQSGAAKPNFVSTLPADELQIQSKMMDA
jgi:hypothetical protein